MAFIMQCVQMYTVSKTKRDQIVFFVRNISYKTRDSDEIWYTVFLINLPQNVTNVSHLPA